MRRHWELEAVISPVVRDLGYQFIGLEHAQSGRRSVLRIYIDKVGGLTTDDCQRVSRQVKAVLLVEDLVKGEYNLEVSSPGIDRILFTPEQFAQQLGKVVAINLKAPVMGRRNYKGLLDSLVNETQICIAVGDDKVILSFADIDQARLVPQE